MGTRGVDLATSSANPIQRESPELHISEAASRLAGAAGRPDLVEALRISAARVRRSSTIVCVVGEFKQGKSSLVNALLGRNVCPVDDDLATSAVTLIHHGDHPAAAVHRRTDQGVVVEPIPLDSTREWVTEAHNPDNRRGVERLDIAVPSELLASGLTLVDTPGSGGLAAGHAAATIGFLPFADALLFVSDASAELSEPEVAFLRLARSRCPVVVVVLTKVDLYPDWRRLADINRDHLRDAGVDTVVVPVSSQLRITALRTANTALDEESGIADLIDLLTNKVIETARRSARVRTLSDVGSAVAQIKAAAATELASLQSPEGHAAVLADLARAQQELEHLKGPAARWQLLLNDRWSTLNSDVNHHFRAGLRGVTKMMDDQLESLSTAKAWDDFSAAAQNEIAQVVADTFERVLSGGAQVAEAVFALVREDQPNIEFLSVDRLGVDLGALWESRAPGAAARGAARKVGRGANNAVDAMRGAQGGLMVLSLLQTAIPTAGMALLVTNPFLLAGLGLWTGGRTLLDGRKRKVAQQRQQVRVAITKLLDDVGFEIGDQLTTVMRTGQQTIRDEVTDRFNQLLRSATQLQAQAQAATTSSQAETDARIGAVNAVLRDADDLMAKLADLNAAHQRSTA